MRDALVWLIVAAGVQGQSRSLAEHGREIAAIVQSARPAVVQIFNKGVGPANGREGRSTGFLGDQEATGSGFFVTGDGYVITNAHVVSGARKLTVLAQTSPGAEPQRHDARLTGFDRHADIAVLKVEIENAPHLTFADSSTAFQGQFVLALGSPLGLRNTLTVGVLSATQRHLRDDEAIYYLQTDAPINPGNSGGPLLDTEGRVIGMNTLIYTQSGGSEGIGFALPSNVIRREYELIRRDGRVRHGAIGVVPQTVTPVLAKALGLTRTSGVLLADVIPQSAAESAGLQVGDVLISGNGIPLREARDLIRLLYLFRRGETLDVELVRGTDTQKLKVAVLERPSEEDAMAELLSMEAELVRPIGIFAAPLDANVNAVMPNLRKLNGVAVVGVSLEFAGLNPGLQAGDVIYSVNKKPVASPGELLAALAAFKPGDPVVLHFERTKLLRFLAFELE